MTSTPDQDSPMVAASPSAHGIAPPYEHLLYREDGPVAFLTLNRPQVRNALSIQMSDELIHAFERLRDSSTYKVVVIDGAHRTRGSTRVSERTRNRSCRTVRPWRLDTRRPALLPGWRVHSCT